MLRRLHAEQPEAFAFTPANRAWAEAQIAKYPEGRQASAIIPLLWRAQEQEGWLTRPAIEAVADMLGMPYIRALEVATFYFMFQLAPVGRIAHVQICGTTPCMLRGSEDLIEVCRRRISEEPHHPSADGLFSWEEVECLGACANAPMAQIGKDYYEDLTPESLERLLDALAAGEVPVPGSQIGRFASEPEGGPTTLTQWAGEGRQAHNGSVALALEIGDTVKRIDGTEVPLVTPWRRSALPEELPPVAAEEAQEPRPSEGIPADGLGITVQEAEAESAGRPDGAREPGRDARASVAPSPAGDPAPVPEQAPALLQGPREGDGDDLEAIEGIGPKLAALLHELGIWHYDQIAAWGPGEIAWVNSRLGSFRGRVERDDWVGQARRLLAARG